MKKVLALYFSGTGNTRYAVSRLCGEFSKNGIECRTESIENFAGGATDADTIIVAYPIYGSCIPRPMKEFLFKSSDLFRGKNLITLATQYLASGDGGALAARLLKRVKIEFKHLGSLHINLPNNICDMALLKVKNGAELSKKVNKADKKIAACAGKILRGKAVRNGRGIFSQAIGLFTQRIYYSKIEKKFMRSYKIDESLCVVCGKCEDCCPVKNLILKDGKIEQQGKCAVCYRCVNLCPKKAISIIGKRPPKSQYKGIE